jgi:hypothetical protein
LKSEGGQQNTLLDKLYHPAKIQTVFLSLMPIRQVHKYIAADEENTHQDSVYGLL